MGLRHVIIRMYKSIMSNRSIRLCIVSDWCIRLDGYKLHARCFVHHGLSVTLVDGVLR